MTTIPTPAFTLTRIAHSPDAVALTIRTLTQEHPGHQLAVTRLMRRETHWCVELDFVPREA